MILSDSERSTSVLEADDMTPVIPLKDIVIFPNMVVPLFIGRQKSIIALERAQKKDSMVILVSQKSSTDSEVKVENIHDVGTYAKILQVLRLPDGINKVLVEGKTRVKAQNVVEREGVLYANPEALQTKYDISQIEMEATRRELIQSFDEFAKFNQKIPDEVLSLISKIENIEQLTDVITTHVVSDINIRQELLETMSLKRRLNRLLDEVNREIEILNVEKRIHGRVKQQIERNQKEYYLHEQAKAIQQELGDQNDVSELETLADKIKKAKMSEEGENKAMSELKKLKLMPPMSSESSIIRSYIEHLIELPWNKSSKIIHDLDKAQKVLDKDHYGLDKIKERIIEYLAVQKRVENNKAPILCFVGPPGVGKTSLGESIARATGRKYVRAALGGLHDEAEIRGHRKTYIGAMPGKIIQNIIKSGVKNPLFLLDEIDKVSTDYRGDPTSALLEVLDPEQNKGFMDNYSEVSFDLSQVMFIATANSLNIQGPLRDRMEIIRLSGYTELEKIKIAEEYLIPKQIENNGLKPKELCITEDAIIDTIRFYTSEAGVRDLDRQLGKICRKAVTHFDLGKSQDKTLVVTPKNLHDFLGVQIYDYGVSASENRVGRVTGLAWTEVGGAILTIEAVAVPGKGQTILTGKLGDVMKESIQAAISLVRSNARMLGIEAKAFETHDLHIHVPEGATPKDGPSAGVGMVTAIASSLNKVPIKSSVAMTGEITLYGEVLPIGGLKEKLLAALRAGTKTVVIPDKNLKDLEEIPSEVKDSLKIIPAKMIDEVLKVAFEYQPSPVVEAIPTNKTHDGKDEPQKADIVKKLKTSTRGTTRHSI